LAQGRDAVLRQLNERTGKDEESTLEAFIQSCQEGIATLIQRAQPYEIPQDYIFFLEQYGGFCVVNNDYYLATLGIGPMVEEWYTAIDSDSALPNPGKHGFLSIGSLSFRTGKYRFQRVTFYLDIAGIIARNCVIGVGPWGQGTITSIDIIEDVHAYLEMWRQIANSFTGWLDKVAETGGAFDYIE
jgi:hypothetical protein